MKKLAIVLAGLALAFAASDAAAGTVLYATDASDDHLYILSTVDGSATDVGAFGSSGVMAGLAYDATNDVLYGTDPDSNLYSINRSTGAATSIGPLGAGLMHGLGFDNSTGTLYGTFGGSASDELYQINTSTGAATFIGNIGFFFPDRRDTVYGLAVHPQTHVLYGSVSGPSHEGALITIDKSTGEGTLVSTTQALMGLAFHPKTNVIYGVDNGVGIFPKGLYTVNVTTGQSSLVGNLTLGNPLGLAFVPEPSTLVLLCMGAVGLLAWGWRRGSMGSGR